MSLEDKERQTIAGRSRFAQILPIALMAAICGLVFYEAATSLLEQGNASGSPIQNAALYPKLLAFLMLALVVLQLVAELRDQTQHSSEMPPATGHQKSQILLTVLTLVLYMTALSTLGFILASTAFVFALLLIFGDRNPLTLVAVPPAVSAGCLLIFQVLFNVNLPRGVLGIAVNF